MARIVSMGPLGDLSGTVAGQVMARNRYGRYCRNYVLPVNPSTAKQENARAAVGDMAIAWASLTAGQRNAWNTYAASVPVPNRIGGTDYITGFNHFVRSNSSRLRIPTDVVSDGPSILSLPAPDSTIVITASEATQQLSVAFDDANGWESEDGGFMMLYCGFPQSPTRTFYAGKMIHIGQFTGDTGVPLTTPQTANVPAEFAFVSGQKLFLAHRIMRADGRLSTLFQTSCTAGA